MNWQLLSFVKRSEQRQIILKSLFNPKTPTDIKKETRLAPSHISRTLKEFTKKGIVICLTPKQKIGRIYKLSQKGEKLLKHLNKFI